MNPGSQGRGLGRRAKGGGRPRTDAARGGYRRPSLNEEFPMAALLRRFAPLIITFIVRKVMKGRGGRGGTGTGTTPRRR